MSQRQVFSVSDLVRRAKRLLEDDFGLIWLEGEISNFSAPSSGHWYFSLKDEQAQIRAACFRNRNQLLSFRPKDGDKVLVRARVTLYEARGDFQLSIEYLEAAGYGQLQQQFEALKQQLATEGLFAAQRKKPIPSHITTLGIVTSASGAAIRDVLTVLQRRAPQLRVIIYPALVQGNDAAASLIRAIETAERRNEVDALLLTRGGGSFEDLFCFNDEKLARVIAAGHLPTISAVGHEIDFTICDFVADLRAPTPSAAAEMLARDNREQQQQLQHYSARLAAAQTQHLKRLALRLNQLQQRLPSPQQWLDNRAQRLDELRQRLPYLIQNRWQRAQQHLSLHRSRLLACSPQNRLTVASTTQQQLALRLTRCIKILMQQKRQTLQQQAVHLHSLSPLATLTRGYSITRVAQTKTIVTRDTPLTTDSTLETLSHGEVIFSQFISRQNNE